MRAEIFTGRPAGGGRGAPKIPMGIVQGLHSCLAQCHVTRKAFFWPNGRSSVIQIRSLCCSGVGGFFVCWGFFFNCKYNKGLSLTQLLGLWCSQAVVSRRTGF